MKKPHGIHPRAPFLTVRMTEAEARDLIDLLEGVDRPGAVAAGMSNAVRHYDNLVFRIGMARVHFPVQGSSRRSR